MPDGKAISYLRSVTVGRVAKMPGGEQVGKCRVIWGLEVGVPGHENVGDTGNTSANSHPG